MKKIGAVADAVLASPPYREKMVFTRWQAGEMLVEALERRDVEHAEQEVALLVGVGVFLSDIFWDETGDGTPVATFSAAQINALRAAVAGDTLKNFAAGVRTEPTTELEKQLRAHLTLVEYFARKCVEGLATPLEALRAIRETAMPFINPVTDDNVLVVRREEPTDASLVDKIKREVANQFGLKPRMLSGPGRHKAIAHPRMVAMYLARKLTKMSFPQIGENFGRRDHTTVMSAVEKIERLLLEDSSVRDCVDALVNRLALKERTIHPCGHSDVEHAQGFGGQSCTVLALPVK